jgi:ferredoxin
VHRHREPSSLTPEMQHKGTEIVEEVKPIAGEVVIEKTAPSGFQGTPLMFHLNSLGVDTLIVCGENSSVTVVDYFKSADKLPAFACGVNDLHLAAGAKLPFACKGGVCCTCKARLTEGQVAMHSNYGLEPDEIAAGLILTCQAFPLTETVSIDFDV